MKAKRRNDYRRIYEINQKWLDTYYNYRMCHYENFDYKVLDLIQKKNKPGKAKYKKSYSDCIIMADTETSKCKKNEYEAVKKPKRGNVLQVIPVVNYVVAWTISIRAFDRNIVTLYGHKPSEFIICLNNILAHMPGEVTYIYFHNLAYDWTFLKRFLIKEYGEPESQLNVKSHYPLFISWPRFTLRDSLLLAQRGLERWADDLNVEHKKASGKWDYDKIRNQNGEDFTQDELEYIEHDTLAGVECIQKTLDNLGKNISSIPLTATGIPRNEARKRGKQNAAHDNYFILGTPEYEVHLILEAVYHGGFTHANRHYIGEVFKACELNSPLRCYDFKSSYPYQLLTGKYPVGGWQRTNDYSMQYILEHAEDYGFIFKLSLYGLRLKPGMPMPAIQLSKCLKTVNAIADNGRILEADYIEFYTTSEDLKIIAYQYDFDAEKCSNIYFSRLDYLPKWFTDYVFECFINKEGTDKEINPVAYSMSKSTVNSLYGMCAQKPVKEEIEEDYATGEYFVDENKQGFTYMKGKYEEWKDKKANVLLYSTGVWCTALAQHALFDLGRCCKHWIYSDTDSIYGYGWDVDKVAHYNEVVKKKIKDRGYGSVINAKGKESWLGVAEIDDHKEHMQEFVTLGSKRYAYRDDDGVLKITVAGVPKKGAKCLNDNIEDFKPGMIFDGKTTGKKLHSYIIAEDIYTDENGNECADSIDLNPCDYLLDQTELFTEEDFNALFEDEIITQEVYAYDD